jgi:hypothetical protein
MPATWLTVDQDGKSEALDLELTVVDGDYAKRESGRCSPSAASQTGTPKRAELAASAFADP